MAEEFDAVAIRIKTDGDASSTIFAGSMELLEMKTKPELLEKISFFILGLYPIMLVSRSFARDRLRFAYLSQTVECMYLRPAKVSVQAVVPQYSQPSQEGSSNRLGTPTAPLTEHPRSNCQRGSFLRQ